MDAIAFCRLNIQLLERSEKIDNFKEMPHRNMKETVWIVHFAVGPYEKLAFFARSPIELIYGCVFFFSVRAVIRYLFANECAASCLPLCLAIKQHHTGFACNKILFHLQFTLNLERWAHKDSDRQQAAAHFCCWFCCWKLSGKQNSFRPAPKKTPTMQPSLANNRMESRGLTTDVHCRESIFLYIIESIVRMRLHSRQSIVPGCMCAVV